MQKDVSAVWLRRRITKSVESHKYSNLVCVCLSTCSQVQEHGDGGVDEGIESAILPGTPGEGSEGRLAEETAQHHEKLAAALVCAAHWPALLL